MRDFRNDTWDLFNDKAKEKDIIIFGASASAKSLLEYGKKLNSRWKVKGIVDNDKNKWKTEFEGFVIESPSIIMQCKEDIVVLICSMHTGEIAKQLETMGVQNYYSDFWMNTPIKVSYQQIVPIEQIEWIKSNVCDEESKRVLNCIVEKRKNNVLDYTDIKYLGKSDYFIEDFWRAHSDGNEVFIDGGGYTGDSIEEFIHWTKGTYKAIYSFEPDPDKAKIIESNLWKWQGKVHLYKRGLYDRETELSFIEGDNLYSGKIVTDGTEKAVSIKTIALDSVVKEQVTFLKLDIEGAELAALEGARKIITRDKPRLAICIYHKLEDLWEIPRLILQMVPEYKIRIRHCGVRCRGTVCYASVEEF